MHELITYVGLDVHKNTIAIALAEAGKRGDVRAYGQIANTPAALKAVVVKLVRGGGELQFCYEAWTLRLWDPSAIDGGRARMRRRCAVSDPAQAWRPDQDGPAGCYQPGQAAPGR